jgi:hypothetical protein
VEQLRREMAEMRGEMAELKELVQGTAPILRRQFVWSEDNASVSTVPAFKGVLLSAYSPVRTGRDGVDLAYCMLTHVWLPKRLVIAAHLWKRQWVK